MSELHICDHCGRTDEPVFNIGDFNYCSDCQLEAECESIESDQYESLVEF